jgi:hypothetical protein
MTVAIVGFVLLQGLGELWYVSKNTKRSKRAEQLSTERDIIRARA